MKVLALDYGRARTGVAVSDPTGTIARPLCVVEKAATGDGLARLAALIGEHEVDRVVVGLPLTLRGERGEQVRETERFVDALNDVTNVPVVTFDERFTMTFFGGADNVFNERYFENGFLAPGIVGRGGINFRF